MSSRHTRHGIQAEHAEVVCMACHQGYVLLRIETPKQAMDIRVTPSGIIRAERPTKIEFRHGEGWNRRAALAETE